MPVAGYVSGGLRGRRTLAARPAATFASIIGGIGVLSVFGVIGMAVVLEKSLGEALFLAGAFLPGDLIKAVIAGFVTQALARMRPASLLSRA